MLVTLAPALATPSPPLGDVRRTTLDNGLTVLVLEEPASELVTVGVAYRVGARNEAAGTTGLAHYAEHMTFRGTRRLPGSELSDSVTRRGGRSSAYTWIDQTYYASTLERSGLDHLLDLEAERMGHALFEPEEFRKERTSVLAELRSYDDPRSLLYDAVLAASFEIHPYRNNTIGWLSDVEGVTRDEAYRFYRRFYAPNHAVLVVAGALGAEDVIARVRDRFSSLPPSADSTEVRTVEPPATGPKRLTLRRPGPHAQLVMAFRAPGLREADFPSLVLFDALFAGGRGFAGSILRSAGHGAPYPSIPGTPLARAMADHAREGSSDWQVSTYPYVYTLSASVARANGLAGAEAALVAALEQAAGREWTEDERERALRQVRAGVALDLDDQRGRVHQLALFEVAGGYEHMETLLARVARVTTEEMRRFARERLSPERATVGWFEPTNAAFPAVVDRVPAEAGPKAAPAPPPPPRTQIRPRRAPGSPIRVPLRTASGLRAQVEARPGAVLAALGGRIEAGSAHDGPWPGVAALATELLARPLPEEGASGPSFFWRLHDDPGAAVSLEAIEFTAAFLPEDLPRVVDALARRLLRRPPPEGPDFDSLRKDAARRATARSGSAEGRLWGRALAELFPPGDPASRPPWSDEASLSRLTPAALRSFWKESLAPERIRLAIAGDVSASALGEALERAFPLGAPLPRHPPLRSETPRGGSAWKDDRIAVPAVLQDEVLVVWPGDRSRPRDGTATAALLYLLGETGYAGRLGRALVEPGLVYSVQASLEGRGASSFLAVRTACDPKDTPEVLRRIRAILEEAGRGTFTEAERKEADAYLRGKAARLRDGSLGAAASLLHEPDEPAPAPTLALADINDAARRLFTRGFPVSLVAGAESSGAAAAPRRP